MTANTLSALRLLILDDDANALRTIAQMAGRLGISAKACLTLAEFETALGSFDPDFVLIDLMMPDLDGIDVACRIDPASRAKIIVTSGADQRTCDASCRVLSTCCGQNVNVLRKPFGIAELAQTLSRVRHVTQAPGVRESSQAKHKVLSPREFAEAVRSDRIEPVYQPIVHANGRGLKGFEALARVSGADITMFAPEYLAQLVADHELSAALTEIVTRRALKFLAEASVAENLSISINVFGVNAISEEFRELLIQQCRKNGISPNRIILELSEETVVNLDHDELRKITQLRLAGFGLAIDDFGMGRSSLGRLSCLPFSELKIDKAFCLAMPHSDTAAAIVEACLRLAARMNLNVTAEGVETPEVAQMLTAMGCNYLQGHLFGQPMSTASALPLVKGLRAA